MKYRFIELFLLYFGVPFSILYFSLPFFYVIVPISIFVLIYCRPKLHFRRIAYRQIIVIGFFIFIILSISTYVFLPQFLWYVPRNIPLLMFVIALFYPLFSVFPQTLVYRTFFYARYASLFPKPHQRIVANALLFSFGHIIFMNVIAVVVTFIAGLLFAYRYEVTRSEIAVTVEHALYGFLVFMSGMGVFLVQSLMI